MREFIYFSGIARTSGNFDMNNLMKAGRMDIALHVFINSFFISNAMRRDVKLHLVFYGPPDPPKHLEIFPMQDKIMPDEIQGNEKTIDISKKDVAGLIRRMLFKYKPGIKHEVWPGYWIEKKSLLQLIEELKKQGKIIYILDSSGENIRNAKIDENPVFLLGDHKGLPLKEFKRLKKTCKTISLGRTVYFASQAVTIVNYEMDGRG